jgi:hypothetical protein
MRGYVPEKHHCRKKTMIRKLGVRIAAAAAILY